MSVNTLSCNISFAQDARLANTEYKFKMHYRTIDFVEFAVHMIYQSLDVFDCRSYVTSRATSVFAVSQAWNNADNVVSKNFP